MQLPRVGDLFEGRKVTIARNVDGQRRIKLEDGILIAFDLETGAEIVRRCPVMVSRDPLGPVFGVYDPEEMHTRALRVATHAPQNC